ncbi:MAG TPA: M1 family aminopeptidase [Pyrinomonadaceae bacterium]|jgi:aminopeptidase N
MKLFAFLLFLTLMMTEISCAQNPPAQIEAGVSQALAKWRAAHYSDVRYKLNLTLEKQAPLMAGEIEIRVDLSEEGAKQDLILDWRTTQFANDKDKPFAEVVKVNESVVKELPGSGNFAYAVDKEHIIIAKRLLKAGENVIDIKFGSPIKTSGAALTRYVDKEDGAEYIYSLFVPSDASTAFPVFDQPDLKARFTLEVASKSFERVVSNSIGKTSDYNTDTDRFTFAETKPISTYVFAFAAGDFVDFQENRPVNEKGESIKDLAMEGTVNNFRVFVRRSQAEKFKPHEKEFFRLTREGVKTLETYFDHKFPFSKYDTVLIPEFPFGGMEHAGATFLREASVIFPSEPTKNDYVSRANLIFHEAAHQWFGDTVTMKWFDDLWLKEGFAEFMAYKTLEKVMPEYNAWKAFYERNKPLAYLTDSTKGTTPIYQEIPNLSAAKSAYGNIVYRKAPSFLRQAEFYLGEDKFQAAVRAFLKKHEYANAEWKDLVNEFNKVYDRRGLPEWAEYWVKQPGVPIIRVKLIEGHYEKSQTDSQGKFTAGSLMVPALGLELSAPFADSPWAIRVKTLYKYGAETEIQENLVSGNPYTDYLPRLFDKDKNYNRNHPMPDLIFPNYQDYGYGIFLLDEKSRDYVLKNIETEKDDFLRSMMWGSLWDSVREAELNPKDYVELAIKNIAVEEDESTINAILSRVGTALNYYIPNAARDQLSTRLETVLTERIGSAKTPGQRITFYRAYLNLASSAQARQNLKDILAGKSKLAVFQLRTKDKFDLVTRLLVLGDNDAPQLLANLEKTETSDDAKRYAYAARAGIATTESKAKYFRDFMTDKNISESWIEAAFVPFNSARHSELTLPYLETALAELPNLKRTRKIFFVNGWLGAFLGGQKSREALDTVNKFLASNQSLDKDLRLKILENVDGLERAVKIREKFGK